MRARPGMPFGELRQEEPPRERTASTYLKVSSLNSPGPALTWPHATAILRNSSTQPHLSRTSTVGEVLPRSGSRGVTAARPRDTAPLALTTCALARSINSVVVPKVDGREEGPCLGGRLSLPPLVRDAWSSAVPGPRGARGLREGAPRGASGSSGSHVICPATTGKASHRGGCERDRVDSNFTL